MNLKITLGRDDQGAKVVCAASPELSTDQRRIVDRITRQVQAADPSLSHYIEEVELYLRSPAVGGGARTFIRFHPAVRWARQEDLESWSPGLDPWAVVFDASKWLQVISRRIQGIVVGGIRTVLERRMQEGLPTPEEVLDIARQCLAQAWHPPLERSFYSSDY